MPPEQQPVEDEGTGPTAASEAAAPVRKIIHIDMDAFFASVEQRDQPALRGLPVAVGGSAERGVVAAASYEARRFGVRSAMPSVTAKRQCPDLIFVPPRFEVYRAVSAQIHAVFAEHTPVIEPLSLDEAYLDVTENLLGIASATEIARRIRAAIQEATGLTASAGVSYNKFLAKLASDHRKPDGLFVITPRMGPGFVEDLPVARFHGVGPVTAARMQQLGIHTGLDLRQQSLALLVRHFGKAGPHYYSIARGDDQRPVRAHRERKSVGAETTFARDLTDKAALQATLAPLAAKVWEHCRAKSLQGRTVTLKVKFSDFRLITRSHSTAAPVASLAELLEVAGGLLSAVPPGPGGIRLVGVSISAFGAVADGQLALALQGAA